MMWWWNDGWSWFAMLFSMVLVWLAVIWVLVFLARWLNVGEAHYAAVHGPKEILADRFARGEIDEQEYVQRMAALQSPAGGTK